MSSYCHCLWCSVKKNVNTELKDIKNKLKAAATGMRKSISLGSRGGGVGEYQLRVNIYHRRIEKNLYSILSHVFICYCLLLLFFCCCEIRYSNICNMSQRTDCVCSFCNVLSENIYAKEQKQRKIACIVTIIPIQHKIFFC